MKTRKSDREELFNMMRAGIDTKSGAAVEYLKKAYSRVLIPDEDGGYSAEILEFPGCYSQGDTAKEALANVEEAARNWIEATLNAGKPIPPPSTEYEYAGRVALRLPRSIHRLAVRMAERDGVSLNQWLTTAIAARVGAEELYNRIAERAEHVWFTETPKAATKGFTRVLKSVRWTDADDATQEEGLGQDADAKDIYFRGTTKPY